MQLDSVGGYFVTLLGTLLLGSFVWWLWAFTWRWNTLSAFTWSALFLMVSYSLAMLTSMVSSTFAMDTSICNGARFVAQSATGPMDVRDVLERLQYVNFLQSLQLKNM